MEKCINTGINILNLTKMKHKLKQSTSTLKYSRSGPVNPVKL